MSDQHRRRRVEDACARLVTEGTPVTFDAVAARARIGRATLYRNPDLHAIVAEQRLRGREAQTLTGLGAEIAHLRTALDALAAKVRSQEEQLRALHRRR